MAKVVFITEKHSVKSLRIFENFIEISASTIDTVGAKSLSPDHKESAFLENITIMYYFAQYLIHNVSF